MPTYSDQDALALTRPPASGLGYMRALAAMASQLGWMVPAGLAGSYDLLTGKGMAEADESIKSLMANAYSPTDEDSFAAMQDVADFPLSALASKASEVGGDIGYDIAGPAGGTLGQMGPDLLDMMFGSHGTASQAAMMIARTLPAPHNDLAQVTAIHPSVRSQFGSASRLPSRAATSYIVEGNNSRGDPLDLGKIADEWKRAGTNATTGAPVFGDRYDFSRALRNESTSTTLGNVLAETDPHSHLPGIFRMGLTDIAPFLRGQPQKYGNFMYSNVWDDLLGLGFEVGSDLPGSVSREARRVYNSMDMNKKYNIHNNPDPSSLPLDPLFLVDGSGNPIVNRFNASDGRTAGYMVDEPEMYFFDQRVDPDSYWPDDTAFLDRLARSGGTQQYPNAQFLSLMDPHDFVRMTTFSSYQPAEIAAESLNLPNMAGFGSTRINANRVRNNQHFDAFPMLNIDPRDSRIVGHEGRHRSSTWARQGGELVPVRLRFTDADRPPTGFPARAQDLKGQFRPNETLMLDPNKTRSFSPQQYSIFEIQQLLRDYGLSRPMR